MAARVVALCIWTVGVTAPSPARLPSPAQLRAALETRSALLATLRSERTDCVRVLAQTEGQPGAGVTLDKYGGALLVQTFRAPLDGAQPRARDSVDNAALIGGLPAGDDAFHGVRDELLAIAEQVRDALELVAPPRIVLSHRGAGVASRDRPESTYVLLQAALDEARRDGVTAGSAGARVARGAALGDMAGADPPRPAADETCVEFGLKVLSAIVPGRDAGIFLDFRAGRRWVRAEVTARSAAAAAAARRGGSGSGSGAPRGGGGGGGGGRGRARGGGGGAGAGAVCACSTCLATRARPASPPPRAARARSSTSTSR